MEGLPAEAQGEALAVVEGIAIDVVRSEDLPPHWRERLRQRSRELP